MSHYQFCLAVITHPRTTIWDIAMWSLMQSLSPHHHSHLEIGRYRSHVILWALCCNCVGLGRFGRGRRYSLGTRLLRRSRLNQIRTHTASEAAYRSILRHQIKGRPHLRLCRDHQTWTLPCKSAFQFAKQSLDLVSLVCIQAHHSSILGKI